MLKLIGYILLPLGVWLVIHLAFSLMNGGISPESSGLILVFCYFFGGLIYLLLWLFGNMYDEEDKR